MTNTNERTFTVHFIEEIESEAYDRVPSGFYYLCHGERK